MAAVESVMVPCGKWPKSSCSKSFHKGSMSSQDEETEENLPSDDVNNTGELEVPSADETENFCNG